MIFSRKFFVSIIFFLMLFACVKDENDNLEPPSVFFDVEVSSESGGTVDTSGGSFKSGTTITLTATPNSGFIFSGWSNGATQNPLTIKVNSDETITALFSKEKYSLLINVIGDGEVKEEIINTEKTDYESGTTVRLTPIPAEDWAFYRWNNQIIDTTFIKEIEITEPKTVDIKFDFASGKKMIGQWELGSNSTSLAKSPPINKYLLIDYALNFFIVESNDGVIDQSELDDAQFGIIDPTSPTEFNLNFGQINIPDFQQTQDISGTTIGIEFANEDFGKNYETFPMKLIVDDKTVDLNIDKVELSIPKADDGTISPPTTYTADIDSEEIIEITESLIEDFKKEVIEIVDDQDLFPEVCLSFLESVNLSSNNDDDDIECDEDIKITAEFERDILAPVELIMTDKDGNFEFLGMTPVTTTPSASIDLTTDTFSEWEANISRDGVLNWVDVSTDNSINLSVQHKCYTGSEELVYDLFDECFDCDEITSATLTSNNDDDDIECDEDIKVTVDFGSDVLAPVELIMTDSFGNEASIGMTPVTTTPSASIDLTTDTFSEWEVNISKAGETSWTNYTAIDTSADDTVKLSISNSCYTGVEEIIVELIECIDDSLTSSNTIYNIGVNAPSSSDYSMNGNDLNGTVTGNDPSLTFNVGDTVNFNVDSPGHPFYLKTTPGTGTGDLIPGVTNNGATEDTVTWIPSTPGTYYYQCSLHSGMTGTITIL